LVANWEYDSAVSRFLRATPGASVEMVMSQTGQGHSFALEARVRGVLPRDLMAYAYELPELAGANDGDQDEQSGRRALERLLQLITDPVCGRR